jgi:hypothetical protein
MAHPDLQNLRRWVLVTADAHVLYARHGFEPLVAPERFMERRDPDVYQHVRVIAVSNALAQVGVPAGRPSASLWGQIMKFAAVARSSSGIWECNCRGQQASPTGQVAE